MGVTMREIGGAIQKAGVNIGGAAGAFHIKRLGKKNGDSTETITENLASAGQETRERLAAIDQKVKAKDDASRAYKEAYQSAKNNGDDSVVRDAINRDREAKNPKTPLLTTGDERANINTGGENSGIMYTEPAAPVNEVAIYHENPYAGRDLKTAADIAGSGDSSGFKNGLFDFVRENPIKSLGIAAAADVAIVGVTTSIFNNNNNDE